MRTLSVYIRVIMLMVHFELHIPHGRDKIYFLKERNRKHLTNGPFDSVAE